MGLCMDQKITTNSPQETIELGRRIGSQLRGGEVLAIVGNLGAGKTHLIKGIATGAGAQDCARVTSPTFVIVNQYAGRFNIYHLDAYRIESIGQFEMLGFDDLCCPESVVLIEWADKIESAIAGIDFVRVELTHAAPQARTIRITNVPEHIHIP